MQYTQGWFLGAENTDDGYLVPFELMSESGGGQLTASGSSQTQFENELSLTYLATKFTLLNLFQKCEERNFHLNIPVENLTVVGKSFRLALAYSLMFHLSGKPLKDPVRVGLSGDLLLNGSVMPVGYIAAKRVASERHGLDVLVLPKQSDDETTGKNEIRVSSLGDLFEGELLRLKRSPITATLRKV